MKVYINRKPVSGPWGGGNGFVDRLQEHLRLDGYEVSYDLNDNDIDVIFCFDPRFNLGVSYADLLQYKQQYGVRIVQRVGDLGTHSKPELTQLLLNVAQHSDFLIFPSEWAKSVLDRLCPYELPRSIVIPNKPRRIFYKHRQQKPRNGESFKIVTHHWSTNSLKGFDFYRALDESLPDGCKFTYIGRLPTGFSFKNADHLGVMNDEELIKELPKHDLYLTASQLEAGANHVLEAMACGLPVVCRDNGGSVNEYCRGQGLEFSDISSMLGVVKTIRNDFQMYWDQAIDREHDSLEKDVVPRYVSWCKIAKNDETC